MMRFSDRSVAERVQPFFEALQARCRDELRDERNIRRRDDGRPAGESQCAPDPPCNPRPLAVRIAPAANRSRLNPRIDDDPATPAVAKVGRRWQDGTDNPAVAVGPRPPPDKPMTTAVGDVKSDPKEGHRPQNHPLPAHDRIHGHQIGVHPDMQGTVRPVRKCPRQNVQTGDPRSVERAPALPPPVTRQHKLDVIRRRTAQRAVGIAVGERDGRCEQCAHHCSHERDDLPHTL